MSRFFVLVFLSISLTACGTVIMVGAPPTETPTATPTATLTPTLTLTLTPTVTPTITVTPSPTLDYPAEGYGPSDFPANVDPLTGLKLENPSLLERRPMIVKVANLPRNWRPQWGLSFADQVFEYYIEEGTTRFAAVFLGQDSDMVGPIRSARFFDNHLVMMYRAIFAFGSADYRVLNLLYNQSYARRLVIETACPPMCRYEPNGANFLVTNTAKLAEFINARKVSGGNGRQNLDGFHFNYALPFQGAQADQVTVRYSAAIYDRWDYNPETGKYYRSVDQSDDFQNGANEVYAPLIDRLTGEQISADNVVLLYVTHQYYLKRPEIVDIVMSGPGKAYLFRDGQMYELTWYRNALDQLFIIVGADGKQFPLKPGNTWFEVVGSTTEVSNDAANWRFVFHIP